MALATSLGSLFQAAYLWLALWPRIRMGGMATTGLRCAGAGLALYGALQLKQGRWGLWEVGLAGVLSFAGFAAALWLLGERNLVGAPILRFREREL